MLWLYQIAEMMVLAQASFKGPLEPYYGNKQGTLPQESHIMHVAGLDCT